MISLHISWPFKIAPNSQWIHFWLSVLQFSPSLPLLRQVLTGSPGWPGIHRNLLDSASWILGLKECIPCLVPRLSIISKHLFCFLRQGLIMYLWLASGLERSACLCLYNAVIKGVHHTGVQAKLFISRFGGPVVLITWEVETRGL